MEAEIAVLERDNRRLAQDCADLEAEFSRPDEPDSAPMERVEVGRQRERLRALILDAVNAVTKVARAYKELGVDEADLRSVWLAADPLLLVANRLRPELRPLPEPTFEDMHPNAETPPLSDYTLSLLLANSERKAS